jgi:hypothetical protein
MFKRIGLGFAVVLIVGAMFGCNGGGENTNSPNGSTIVKTTASKQPQATSELTPEQKFMERMKQIELQTAIEKERTQAKYLESKACISQEAARDFHRAIPPGGQLTSNCY